MSVEIPIPDVDHFSGSQLEREVEAAGYLEVRVVQVGTGVEISGKTVVGDDIDEDSRSEVEGLVAAHHYLTPEEVAAELATLRADVEALKAQV